MSLKLVNIEATTLPDAWFQTVYKCIELGRDFIIDQGSYEGEKRLEFDHITIHIKSPGIKPILPKIPSQYGLPDPVDDNYLIDYLPYLMTGELKDGESYTYGRRICEAGCVKYSNVDTDKFKKDTDVFWDKEISGIGGYAINQMKSIIQEYKNKGYRNNQMIIQIAEPSDIILKDPPCLRHIDTRIQDGKLHFFPYFRSWDLWGGLPANLSAIQMMKEYMASEIGVEDGEIIASSKGLHLYNYVWELAELLRGKTIDEFRNEQ